MKIKRLEICGFKSFVDRTVLSFDHNVTGVVGPNGCGKSNIVDAIRWAMGEQSAKTLRGRGMEDVIFNGSEDRGPHGFAEVSITFDNTDGLAPPEYADYAEIMVTRRLDRQGNSDYLLNKVPVRLMDITNLFLGTGVGKRAYSIIEQGRIGYIVSSKPEDRRQMIEEAAGVTKFKIRKRAAERKMDQTRSNLLRVSDIISEIERTLASLKRQAQKAERYKRYREEMRDLELHVASHRWLELSSNHSVIKTELNQESAESEGIRYALRVREAEVESERVEVQRHESRVEQAQTRAYELDNRTKLLESQIEHRDDLIRGLGESETQMHRELDELAQARNSLISERDLLAASLEALEEKEQEADATLQRETDELSRRRDGAADSERTLTEARSRLSDSETRIARAEAVLNGFERRRDEARDRMQRLLAQKDELTQKVVDLQQQAETIRARLTGLSSGKDQTAKHRDQVEQELTDLRSQIQESERTVEGLRERLTDRRSRLRSLEEVQGRLEGMGTGVRSLINDYRSDSETETGIVGLLADRIECPSEWTQALAGYLGDKLQHVVVDNRHAATSAIRFLREGERGRASVIVRRPFAGEDQPTPQAPGVLGALVDLVSFEGADAGVVRRMLHNVFVVETMDVALELSDSHPSCSFVTRKGDVLFENGTVSGGAGEDSGAHMLEVKAEIRGLQTVVASLDDELTAAVTRHGELRAGIAERQAAIESARTEAHGAEIAIVGAEKDLRQAEEDARNTEQRIESVTAEASDIAQALERADDEEREARQEIEQAQASREEASQSVETTEEIFQQRRKAVDEQSTKVTEVRVAAAQARERAEADRGAMERLVRSMEELDNRDRRLRGNIDDGRAQQGALQRQQEESREELASTAKEAMDAHDSLANERKEYEAKRHALAEYEEDLKELRSQIDAATQRVNELSLKEREVDLAIEHLLEQVEDRHRVDVRLVLDEYHTRDIPDAAVKQRAEELQRLIERMGEINLTAIEEYEEKSERFEYLTGQRADLEDALKQLERAIRQMNRESRRLFKEAFHAVNERFKLVFPAMFGGGKAELRLTDPENILESGIDIFAQPPGKRLGSLELMSGGEKALTAVSIIFAIFQYKPSPFCLLDEVDAPLDEANIGRFSEAVRQMTDRSQFIIITHAKRTMEAADMLYGVTMETPGVSKLVAVELNESRKRSSGDESQQAAVA